MRAAIGLRLLLALTLMGWGQLASAAYYSWYMSNYNIRAGDPNSACAQYHGSNTNYGFSFTSSSQAQCKNSTGGLISATNMIRQGDSCVSGQTYNSVTGACETPPPPPPDCSTAPDIYSAQECTYNTSLKLFSCPNSVTSNGCEYVTSPNGNSNCDISTSICVSRYSPSGNQSVPGAPECTEETCSDLPEDPAQAPENCVTNGTSTYCFEDQESGCGSFNGQEGCFEHESGCGTFNGTWGCYSTDKEQRNCAYANGQQVCFDPKDPTQQIPDTSPDHPKNGGNADGNENNDPTAPGSTTGSAQGSEQGATNESIDQLGDDLGGKIDKTNSLLDGITGILDGVADGLSELTEGLLGDEYDGSGDGADGEIEGIGAGAGNDLAQTFTQQLADAQEEQSVTDELNLEKIASDVDDIDFLGEESQFAQLLQFADGLLPTHSSCVDYVIPLQLRNYRADIILPICRIATLRPLLEWVIYIITAIGLWNIAYSTLRMENAKASKGGF